MKTFKTTSEEQAQQIAPQLIALSIWFEVEPMPCDEFEFTVKDDAAHVVAPLFQ